MIDLRTEIQEAQAATAQLEAQAELKRRADALPALQQQLANAQWVEKAAPAADAAEQEAQRILDNVTPQMIAWRRAFVEHFHQLEALIAELPALQREIDLAARHAQSATNTRRKIDALTTGQPESSAAVLGNDFTNLWAQLGGMSEELSPLPPLKSALDLRYEEVLKRLAKRPFALYQPRQSPRRYI